MQILQSTPADINEIFRLYANATAYQAAVKSVVQWPKFERSLVEQEVQEGRQ